MAIDYQKRFLRRILFWLIILTGIFLIWYLLSKFDSLFGEESAYVPVSINAIEIANYKLDAPGMVNPVNLSIISDVLNDESLSFETPFTTPDASIMSPTPNALTSTPAINTTTTPLPNGTSVTSTSANPTLGLPPILPTLEPIVNTVVAPIVTVLPPVVPTLIGIIPTPIPPLPTLPNLFP